VIGRLIRATAANYPPGAEVWIDSGKPTRSQRHIIKSDEKPVGRPVNR